MNAEVKYPLAVVAVFLWIGFVCAISFMEAWLKFQAPVSPSQLAWALDGWCLAPSTKWNGYWLLASWATLCLPRPGS